MFEIKKLKIEIDLIKDLIDNCVVTHVDKENLCAVLHEKELEFNKLNEMYCDGEYPDSFMEH